MIWLAPACVVLALIVFALVLLFDSLTPFKPHPDIDKIQWPVDHDGSR